MGVSTAIGILARHSRTLTGSVDSPFTAHPPSSIRTARGVNGPPARSTHQPSYLREGRDRRDGFSSSHPFQPRGDDVPDHVAVSRPAQRIHSGRAVQSTGRNVRIGVRTDFLAGTSYDGFVDRRAGDCRQRKQKGTAGRTPHHPSKIPGTHKKCPRILEFATHSHPLSDVRA